MTSAKRLFTMVLLTSASGAQGVVAHHVTRRKTGNLPSRNVRSIPSHIYVGTLPRTRRIRLRNLSLTLNFLCGDRRAYLLPSRPQSSGSVVSIGRPKIAFLPTYHHVILHHYYTHCIIIHTAQAFATSA